MTRDNCETAQAVIAELEQRGLVSSKEAAPLAFAQQQGPPPPELARDASLVLAHCGGERGEAGARDAGRLAAHLRPGSYVRAAHRTQLLIT